MNDRDYLSDSLAVVKGAWKTILLIDVVAVALCGVYLYRVHRTIACFRLDFSVPYTERSQIPEIDAGAPFGPVKVDVGPAEMFYEIGLIIRVPKTRGIESAKADVVRFLENYYDKHPIAPDLTLRTNAKEIAETLARIRRLVDLRNRLKRQYPQFVSDAFSGLEREVLAQEQNLRDLREKAAGLDEKKRNGVKLLGVTPMPFNTKVWVQMLLKTILVFLLATMVAMGGAVGLSRR